VMPSRKMIEEKKIPYCMMPTSAPCRFINENDEKIDMYWTKEKTSAFKQRTHPRIHRHHHKEKKTRDLFIVRSSSYFISFAVD
jgi:hypothetical protein